MKFWHALKVEQLAGDGVCLIKLQGLVKEKTTFCMCEMIFSLSAGCIMLFSLRQYVTGCCEEQKQILII